MYAAATGAAQIGSFIDLDEEKAAVYMSGGGVSCIQKAVAEAYGEINESTVSYSAKADNLANLTEKA